MSVGHCLTAAFAECLLSLYSASCFLTSRGYSEQYYNHQKVSRMRSQVTAADACSMTGRDIFYKDTALFKTQPVVDKVCLPSQ